MSHMPDRYEKHRQRIMARLVHGGSILDVGCAQQPNTYLRGERVVGLDKSDMDIQSPYTEHIIGDVTDVDNLLRGRQFDTVLMGELIEHLERPYDVLRSLRNYIADKGTLILSTPNPLGIPVVVAEYLRMRRYFYSRHHAFYFSPRWAWRLLERTGFQVVRTIGCGARIGPLWLPAPLSLSYIIVYVATPV
jgi:2-polyprenyl-3-methyl-5-hydroxy-6-metoxy-1,4-benzoquinol methylase